MSLIMALETYDSIIMTADRLSTLHQTNETLGVIDCFPKSFNAHKLFLTQDGYGISYCGEGKLTDQYLLEQYIQEEICSKDFSSKPPLGLAQYILNSLQPYNKKCTLLMCGYNNLTSFAIEINCKTNEVYNYPDAAKGKIIRYGDTAIADAVLSNNFYYGYHTYRTQDAINLLVYTNQVVAKYQQFQEVLQTVSEECDVLVLSKHKPHKWIISNELHF